MIEVIHFLLFGLVAALHPHCIMLSPLIVVAGFLVMESQPANRCFEYGGIYDCSKRAASPFWRNEALNRNRE